MGENTVDFTNYTDSETPNNKNFVAEKFTFCHSTI